MYFLKTQQYYKDFKYKKTTKLKKAEATNIF